MSRYLNPVVYNLIIAGGREFSDWVIFYTVVDRWFDQYDPTGTKTTIYSGMADGADEMGFLYSEDRGLPCKKFRADWNRYGLSAGKRRNQQMANTGTHLIAFWDGESTGTKDMIKRAEAAQIQIEVQRYNAPVETKTLW